MERTVAKILIVKVKVTGSILFRLKVYICDIFEKWKILLLLINYEKNTI